MEGNQEDSDAGGLGRPRRARLERIANAERDRRAGRTGMAIAAIGEPVEWPARVVVALAGWPRSNGAASRRLLEEGLDLWAIDFQLGSLDAPVVSPPAKESHSTTPIDDDLSLPIGAGELDQAFALAQAEVESMRDVNSVAERVLAEEPLGLAELSGEVVDVPDVLDAAAALESPRSDLREAKKPDGAATSRQLATLESWLHNIERRRARRMS